MFRWRMFASRPCFWGTDGVTMAQAYFDCFSGAGGDMIVGSLIDAGADAGVLRDRLASLGVGGYALSIEKMTKQGFSATRFRVDLEDPAEQPHRHLSDIRAILDSSDLPDFVKEKANAVFFKLAQAEATVHGTAIESVHFHEVGAVDAIVDVVGAIVALDLLGVDSVTCSPLPTGSGTVKCDHGTMPIPAPATAELLKGVPLASCDELGEMTTPTAAAVLTTIAEAFGPMPAMTVESVGYGAGSREWRNRPNVLRVMLGPGSATQDADRITVLETNLDDVTAEVVGYCIERLLSLGALDAYVVPIQMKKSRPGSLLTVLCDDADVAAMERVLFKETTTLGVRRHHVRRTKLRRRSETVETPFGPIRMKLADRDGVITASPEFEDCRAAAESRGMALRDVMAAVDAAWRAIQQPAMVP